MLEGALSGEGMGGMGGMLGNMLGGGGAAAEEEEAVPVPKAVPKLMQKQRKIHMKRR